MIIKELNQLDVKIGDKLVDCNDISDVYTVDKITTLVILVYQFAIHYDLLGIQLSEYPIAEK